MLEGRCDGIGEQKKKGAVKVPDGKREKSGEFEVENDSTKAFGCLGRPRKETGRSRSRVQRLLSDGAHPRATTGQREVDEIGREWKA